MSSRRKRVSRPCDSLTRSDHFNLNLLEMEEMGFGSADDNITASRRLSQASSVTTATNTTVTTDTTESIKGSRSDSNLNSVFSRAVRNVMRDNVKRKADKEMLQQVIKEIETISEKRVSEGFNQWNFSVGVFNCFFIMYMFGKEKRSLIILCYPLCSLVCVNNHLTHVHATVHMKSRSLSRASMARLPNRRLSVNPS